MNTAIAVAAPFSPALSASASPQANPGLDALALVVGNVCTMAEIKGAYEACAGDLARAAATLLAGKDLTREFRWCGERERERERERENG